MDNIAILSGIDIVLISRIERALDKKSSERFLDEVYTASEREYCDGLNPNSRIESYAVRFAAKEAVLKAIGTGILSEGIALTDVEILKNEQKMPYVKLHGRAREYAQKMGVFSISISLSHEKEYAVAACSMLRKINEEQ